MSVRAAISGNLRSKSKKWTPPRPVETAAGELPKNKRPAVRRKAGESRLGQGKPVSTRNMRNLLVSGVCTRSRTRRLVRIRRFQTCSLNADPLGAARRPRCRYASRPPDKILAGESGQRLNPIKGWLNPRRELQGQQPEQALKSCLANWEAS